MTAKLAGPPDGGWGWVVAAAAFLVNGLSYGILRSLGLALPDLAEHFDRSAQDTAWVSALALAVQQAASEGGGPEVGGARGGGAWSARRETPLHRQSARKTATRGKAWVARSQGRSCWARRGISSQPGSQR